MEFFKSLEDRNLWIKLTAEYQIAWEKNLKYFDKHSNSFKPTLQALNPRSMEEALEISQSQLEYDEKNGNLRFTLEELLLLNIKELTAITQKRHQEWCEKFEKL